MRIRTAAALAGIATALALGGGVASASAASLTTAPGTVTTVPSCNTAPTVSQGLAALRNTPLALANPDLGRLSGKYGIRIYRTHIQLGSSTACSLWVMIPFSLFGYGSSNQFLLIDPYMGLIGTAEVNSYNWSLCGANSSLGFFFCLLDLSSLHLNTPNNQTPGLSYGCDFEGRRWQYGTIGTSSRPGTVSCSSLFSFYPPIHGTFHADELYG
jgi:hypothetical protein